MPRIVTMKISYGNNRLKDLKAIVKFEKSLKNVRYEIFPLINKKENTLSLVYRIKDN